MKQPRGERPGRWPRSHGLSSPSRPPPRERHTSTSSTSTSTSTTSTTTSTQALPGAASPQIRMLHVLRGQRTRCRPSAPPLACTVSAPPLAAAPLACTVEAARAKRRPCGCSRLGAHSAIQPGTRVRVRVRVWVWVWVWVRVQGAEEEQRQASRRRPWTGGRGGGRGAEGTPPRTCVASARGWQIWMLAGRAALAMPYLPSTVGRGCGEGRRLGARGRLTWRSRAPCLCRSCS